MRKDIEPQNVRVAICDDTVKTDLVEVGGLELEHLVDTVAADRVTCLGDLLGCTVLATESTGDDLLCVLLEELESLEVGTCGDLDQLSESVADLAFGKCLEEGEVKEGHHGSVVGTQTVLVRAVVDGNLDGDGGIDETDDSGGNTDCLLYTSPSPRD